MRTRLTSQELRNAQRRHDIRAAAIDGGEDDGDEDEGEEQEAADGDDQADAGSDDDDAAMAVDEAGRNGEADGAAMTSVKLRELLKILNVVGRNGDGTKTLVFSQWTQQLDLVEIGLDEAGISHSRIDGSLSRDKREKVLGEFRLAYGPDVLLLSLGAGSVGLNLACASNVILLENVEAFVCVC